jgi:hypothetical protein
MPLLRVAQDAVEQHREPEDAEEDGERAAEHEGKAEHGGDSIARPTRTNSGGPAHVEETWRGPRQRG